MVFCGIDSFDFMSSIDFIKLRVSKYSDRQTKITVMEEAADYKKCFRNNYYRLVTIARSNSIDNIHFLD